MITWKEWMKQSILFSCSGDDNMALNYSDAFYHSTPWKKLRLHVCESRHWTCEECGCYGDQVHHIEEITPDNINDPMVTLNEENLQLLCEECHNAKRKKCKDVNEGLRFDKDGNLIQYRDVPLVDCWK